MGQVRSLAFACVLAWAGFCVSAPAQALEYTFEQVYNASGQFSYIYGPSLNDQGAMAFTAFLPNGTYGAYALTADGTLVTLATTADNLNVSALSASINNSNTVAFHATTTNFSAPLSAIYKSENFGGLTVYASVDSDPGGIQSIQEPWIGDSGAVVYRAGLRPPPEPYGEAALIRGEDLVISGPAATTSYQWPHLNALDDVVSVGSAGISLNDTVVYDSSGSSATMNNAGRIAFFSYTYGTAGIYTGDGTSAPTLYAAATGGTAMGHPDINNSGLIAYIDRIGAQPETVFVGPSHEKMLSNNNLFGSIVTSVSFFRGLNNQGQIAFAYQLSNGQRGIALASPRDPATLGNGNFDNGLALFQVIDAYSDGFAYTPNVAGDLRLQMTTETGVLSVLQSMDTGGNPYLLEFDFDWLTVAGSLEVHVNDQLVLTIGADGSVGSSVGLPAVQSVGDLTHVSLAFTPGDINDPPGGFIRFDLHPGSQATIQIDNVVFAAVPEPGTMLLVLLAGVCSVFIGPRPSRRMRNVTSADPLTCERGRTACRSSGLMGDGPRRAGGVTWTLASSECVCG